MCSSQTQNERKMVSAFVDEPLPTFQPRSEADEESPCLLVPVALKNTSLHEDDQEGGFGQLASKTFQTQLQTESDYSLLKALDARKKRSTSESRHPSWASSAGCLPKEVDPGTSLMFKVNEETELDLVAENKILKHQLAELQNVIVSMCVLNQRQQSVRTSTASLKDSKNSATCKQSNGLASDQHRRSKTELISCVQKVVEPCPQSLLIEPIEKPSLLSTIPPDWMLESAPQQLISTLDQ